MIEGKSQFIRSKLFFFLSSAQPTSAYPAAQTAYVQPTHQAAYATTAPRAAQSYVTYQPAHSTGQYAYATRTQVQVLILDHCFHKPLKRSFSCKLVLFWLIDFDRLHKYMYTKTVVRVFLLFQPAATYETNKTYYTPTAAPAAAATAVYTVADTSFQTGKDEDIQNVPSDLCLFCKSV